MAAQEAADETTTLIAPPQPSKARRRAAIASLGLTVCGVFALARTNAPAAQLDAVEYEKVYDLLAREPRGEDRRPRRASSGCNEDVALFRALAVEMSARLVQRSANSVETGARVRCRANPGRPGPALRRRLPRHGGNR